MDYWTLQNTVVGAYAMAFDAPQQPLNASQWSPNNPWCFVQIVSFHQLIQSNPWICMQNAFGIASEYSLCLFATYLPLTQLQREKWKNAKLSHFDFFTMQLGEG